MDTKYKIIYDKKFYKDLYLIEIRTTSNYYKKIKDKIIKDIEILKYMPRIHKTLYFSKDLSGEYRRMVSGKHIIIYKIIKDKIIIMRIFNQKQNYLNSKNFILREKSQIYKITK